MGHTLTFRSGGEFTMLIGTTGKVTAARDGTGAPESDSPQQPTHETEPTARLESAQNLTALLEIAKALNSSLRLTDVLEKVMDAVIALTDGERCMMLLGRSVEDLEMAAHRNLTDTDPSKQYSQSVVREAYATGDAQILPDVSEDSRFSAQQSIVGLHLRTVMCVPLRLSHFSEDETELGLQEYQTGSGGADGSRARILGVLYVDRRSPTRHFGDQDLSMLESFAGHAAIAIDNARLYEEALEKRRMDAEIRVANRIQRGLLMSDFPEVAGFDMHAFNIPSRGVGGDYYEFFEPGDGSLGFAVGDVSGKGIPAAMLAATLQAAFLAAVHANDDLEFVCSHVNQFLVERTTPERYATFFVGIISPDGALRYINCGHNPALLIGGKQPDRLMGGGLPLGLFAAREYELQTRELESGQLVLTYSDGVTEANNLSEEEFGEDRLTFVVDGHRANAAEAISKGVFDAVDGFSAGASQGDDLTLMVVKYFGS